MKSQQPQQTIVRTNLIHSGKANDVYATNHPDFLEIESTDRASAGNGAKKAIIPGKGVSNNTISTAIFRFLEANGVPTHFVAEGSNTASKLVLAAEMIPLEVICRLETAGSFCKRYECAEGIAFDEPFVEFTYKSDNAGDPPIDRKTIIALAEQTYVESEREVELMEYYTARIAELMQEFWFQFGVKLIDFKVEYGRLESGQIILCDEISPDTCRLVDIETGEKLDKDRFRQDMADPEKGYNELLERITSAAKQPHNQNQYTALVFQGGVIFLRIFIGLI